MSHGLWPKVGQIGSGGADGRGAQVDEQQRMARRPSRDVLTAFLAAGAAGLVVTLVVGGTTAGIDRPRPAESAAVAERRATPVAGSDIEVAVRPARPKAIPVTPADDGRAPAIATAVR